MTPQEKAKIIFDVCESFYEMIQCRGVMGFPEGELYALVMGKMSLDTFNGCIEMLEQAGKITRKGFLLKAV